MPFPMMENLRMMSINQYRNAVSFCLNSQVIEMSLDIDGDHLFPERVIMDVVKELFCPCLELLVFRRIAMQLRILSFCPFFGLNFLVGPNFIEVNGISLKYNFFNFTF